MADLILVGDDGSEHVLAARPGDTAMETIRETGYAQLAALCGGACSCGTCHVFVDPAFLGRLPRMSADEDALLDSSAHRAANSRLSCQIRLSPAVDGIRMTIAPDG